MPRPIYPIGVSLGRCVLLLAWRLHIAPQQGRYAPVWVGRCILFNDIRYLAAASLAPCLCTGSPCPVYLPTLAATNLLPALYLPILYPVYCIQYIVGRGVEAFLVNGRVSILRDFLIIPKLFQ